MEQYIVSARKYRPSTFASVVGQKALTVTLKNSIASDRLAHAYLFCGSRGVGKTSCARIFAKTINCTNRTADGEACNECDSCRQFNENRSLNIIELDAASNNGVDDIRQLIDQTQVPPTEGRYRVFIIDEVHMLSTGAFNAFLKTLEEPPSYVIFILATTEKQKMLPTILSRCQIYDFNRITIADMVDHLKYVASQEGITAEAAALNVIAQKADGAMRDSLSIFDQVAASSRNNITYASTIENLNVLDSAYYNRLLEAFLAGNVSDALLIYKEVRDHGFNNHFFLNGLGDYFRDLVVARDPRTLSLLETDEEHQKQMAALAAKCTPKMLYRAMDLCNSADLNYRTAANKQFLVELTLIKLCQADSPSPTDGDGEGQRLQPIAVKTPTVQPTPAPQPPAPTSTTTSTPPAPRMAPPPPPKPKKAFGAMQTISINSPGKPTETTPPIVEDLPIDDDALVTTDDSMADLPVTDEEMRSAWFDFTELHPHEHIMRSTLRTCIPYRENPATTTFTVPYESPAQKEILDQWLVKVREHVRTKLKNRKLQFDVTKVEGSGSSLGWTETELFDKILENHPEVRELVSKLKLSLE